MAEGRQLGARVPAALYTQVRVLAAQQDRRLGDLVEEALRDLLEKYGKRPDGRRARP